MRKPSDLYKAREKEQAKLTARSPNQPLTYLTSNDKTELGRMLKISFLDQARKASKPDYIMVAYPTRSEFEIARAMFESLGVRFFRGNEMAILDGTIISLRSDFLGRLCGDRDLDKEYNALLQRLSSSTTRTSESTEIRLARALLGKMQSVYSSPMDTEDDNDERSISGRQVERLILQLSAEEVGLFTAMAHNALPVISNALAMGHDHQQIERIARGIIISLTPEEYIRLANEYGVQPSSKLPTAQIRAIEGKSEVNRPR